MSLIRRLRYLPAQTEMKTGGYCSPAVTILLAINTLIFLIALFMAASIWR